MKVWLNGIILDEGQAHVTPADRGFTLGDGLFETLRAEAGTVLRVRAHLARLARGAKVIGLPLPPLDFDAALRETLAANGLINGTLRLTVTRGPGPRGVLPPAEPVPTVVITAAPSPPRPGPARLILARSTRRNEFSPLSAIKSLNYLDNVLARMEAARQGADDAVLLNTRGGVAETSISNIFAVLDGTIVTPPVTEGALPGIMRAEALAHGAVEWPLSVEDLHGAAEIFLTNSLGIRSVASLEGRPLDPGFPHAARLRAAFG